MAPSRLNKPGWKVLGAIALVAFVWFGMPALARRMAFFDLQKVDVRGLRNMRAADIVKALPIREGMSLYDPIDAIELAADSIPGVQDATVSRRWPGTLVVTVKEADPVGLVMRNGKLQLVSDRGRVLRFDPTVAAPDLPLVREADSLVAGFLSHLRASDPTFFATVNSAWRAGDDVVLSVDGQRYWFRPDAPAEVIRAVTIVAQDLAKKERRWAELDARFVDQVVVRWEGA
jgi:cell division septal protein FtsQ